MTVLYIQQEQNLIKKTSNLLENNPYQSIETKNTRTINTTDKQSVPNSSGRKESFKMIETIHPHYIKGRVE